MGSNRFKVDMPRYVELYRQGRLQAGRDDHAARPARGRQRGVPRDEGRRGGAHRPDVRLGSTPRGNLSWQRSRDRKSWPRRSARRAWTRCSISWAGPMLETEAACIQLGIRGDRPPPRAGRLVRRPRLHARDATPRRLHGRLRPRRHQPPDRRGQRVHRLRPAGGDRRLQPPRLPRHGGVPGDRPARGVQAGHQVGRAHLRRQAHPRRRGHRVPPGDQRAGRAPSTSTCPATSSARRSRRTIGALRRRPGSRRRARSATPAPSRRRSRCWPRPSGRSIVAGSGVWWSDGAAALQAFVEATGIPFYTTPISRGIVPEDHALSFLNARSTAFTEADVRRWPSAPASTG